MDATLRSGGEITLSIVIPTYNEAENILKIIGSIKENIPSSLSAEIIVVDDNSLDGTGRIVEDYIKGISNARALNQQQYERYSIKAENENCSVRIVDRQKKTGLISAYLAGIETSGGQSVLLMDADFSHPPAAIPQFLQELSNDPHCIVIASRYIKGGSIEGWPFKRRVLSVGAAKIARHGLKIKNVKDPMSNFFAFPRYLLENVKINTTGYKILVELLVKTRGIRVKEIPYTFKDRKSGESKLDGNVMLDYIKAVWYLYRYGRKSRSILQNKRTKRNPYYSCRKLLDFSQ